jgi:hypothetical protein
MGNTVDIRLDALAPSVEEINTIDAALREPCDELLAWLFQRTGEDKERIAGSLKEILAFKPIRNLGYTDPSINRARRFESFFRDRYWGILRSHMYLVSEHFPATLFLVEYRDEMASYAGKYVIYGGREIRHTRDGNQQAQGLDWVMPDIFAPYWNEYELGLKFGSLWSRWLNEMQSELADLKEFYGAPGAGEEQGSRQ